VGHQFVVSGAAVAAGGIGMDLDQARRLADAVAFVDVFEDRGDLVLGRVGAVQRGALIDVEF
jgi:hypothetical protein